MSGRMRSAVATLAPASVARKANSDVTQVRKGMVVSLDLRSTAQRRMVGSGYALLRADLVGSMTEAGV